MLRHRFFIAPTIALALLLLNAARQHALAAPQAILTLPEESVESGSTMPSESETEFQSLNEDTAPNSISPIPNSYDAGPPDSGNDIEMSGPDSPFSKLKWLGLRHSSVNGRNAGMGIPLTGTSWLNRPYYFGGNLGTVWLTRPINSSVTNDIDMFGGVFVGYDCDHYWGTELAINRATPEIINANAPDARRGDRMMEETISLMYYPWGDSLFRPYWRLGVGATEIDYPNDDGTRRDETLWTIPVGIGLKYPFRRFLAARAEFTDQLAIGNTGVATQHDLTLTFGLEWRFGVHPRSYWPWNPSRHIW